MGKTIKAKVILTIIIVTAITYLVGGMWITRYFFSILKQEALSAETMKMAQNANQLKYIQNEIHSLAKSIAVDVNINSEILVSRTDDVFDQKRRENDIAALLSQYLSMKPHLLQVDIIMSGGEVYSSNLTLGEVDFKSDSWYKNFKESGELSYFSQPHEIYLTQRSIKQEVITYILTFRDMESGKNMIGDIAIHLDFDLIMQNIDVDPEILSGYALYIGDSYPLIKSGKLSQKAVSREMFLAENPITADENIIIFNDNMYDGWYLVYEISNALLKAKLQYVFVFLSVVCILSVGVIILFIYPILARILRPISQLSEVANKVGGGDFSTYALVKGDDEVSNLAKHFNEMMDNLKNHIDRSIAYEKKSKEIELNQLRLQINPHFIYNTLDCIVYMAHMSDCEDIVIFTKSFISLLQDSLSVSGNAFFITVEKEIENINHYLVLQKYRYPDKFEVIIHVDEKVSDSLLPNILIQPLVENAIFHGVQHIEAGVIKISAICKDGKLVLTIADNGAGMTKEKIVELYSADRDFHGAMRPIGFANVKERLEYIYGDKHQLKVDSTVGIGTKITIILPDEKESGDQND